MKKTNTYTIYICMLFATLSFSNCKTTKPIKIVEKTEKNTAEVLKKDTIPSACNTKGTVLDYRNVDGCSLLIELENGDKILPVESLQKGLRLEPEQQLLFGYEILKGMMTACATPKYNVNITCAVVLNEAELAVKNPPVQIDCYDSYKVNEIPWLNPIILKSKPTQVLKFSYFYDEKAYIIKYRDHSELFDCRGIKIFSGKDHECMSRIMEPKSIGIIYQAEGVQD